MADNNRFADAIRRIVESFNKDDIDPADKKTDKEKDPVPGQRGVAVGSSGGGGGIAASSGAVGAASAANKAPVNSVTKAGTDAALAAAVGAALNTLGSSDGTGGAYSGDNLLSGVTPFLPGTVDAAQLAAMAALGGDNSLGTMTGGGRLLAITDLKDCSSGDGKTITIRTDGNYTPPTGWTDVNNPPTADNWTLGYYWTTNSPAAAESSYPSGAAAAAIDAVRAAFPAPFPVGYGDAYMDAGVTPSGINFTFTFYQGPGAPPNTSLILRGTCVGSGTDLCPVSAPVIPWPTGTNYELSRNSDGQFVSHPLDVNVPTTYTTEHSILSLCTSDTDTPVEIVPTKNGGFAFYATSSGAPTGIVQLYASDGSLAGFTDSTTLPMYLP